MTQMKKSRRIQLGFGLVTYAVCSFLWFRINTLEFLHYFPYDSEVNVLMWSYVCPPSDTHVQSITFCLQSVFLICQFLTIPLKYHSIVAPFPFAQ